MVKNDRLIKLSYDDYKNEVHLEVHADTVVMESIDSVVYLAAVRFGGSPEMVRGMADAMYGGGQICIHIGEKLHSLRTHVKQYRKELSHDGIYAEATLMVQDEEQSTESDEDDSGNANNYNRPRKCYLFCEQGNSDQLFEELDKKTAVPRVQLLKGKPCQCHSNTCDLWEQNRNEHEVAIATGYALSEDGMWHQHSWMMLRGYRSVKVIETTKKCIAYFGFVMSQSEALNFCDQNL